MRKIAVPRPTDAELAILRVLWELGPSTVRQVYAVLSRDRSFAYTTTLKLLQIMTEKGLTTREAQGQHHVYRARHAEKDTATPRGGLARAGVRRIDLKARDAGPRREASVSRRTSRYPSPADGV